MAGELLVVGISADLARRAAHLRPRAVRRAEWLLAMMIVILVIGLVVDAAFGAADRAIRRRWGVLDHAGS